MQAEKKESSKINRFGMSPELYDALQYSPVAEEEFINEFAPDVDTLAQWLGPLGDWQEGGAKQEVALTHIQAATRLAGNAMLMVQETSYRSWTPQGRLANRGWARVIWRRSLINALGRLVSRRAIMRHGAHGSWDPLKEGLPQFLQGAQLQIKQSNRSINPEQMEQAIYAHLFGLPGLEFTMMTMALVDSFSLTPNADNPIAQAISWGNERMMSQGRWSLPWWWGQPISSAITEALSPSEATEPNQNAEIGSAQDIAQAAVQFMVDMVAAGRAGVNEKGAWFHRVDGLLYMVTPLVVDQIAGENPMALGGAISAEQATQALLGASVIESVPAEGHQTLFVRPNGPDGHLAAKIKVLAIHQKIGEVIAPAAKDNPDMRLS